MHSFPQIFDPVSSRNSRQLILNAAINIFRKFTNILINLFLDGSGKLSDSSPAGSVGSASEAFNELAGLSLEEQEQQRAEWSQELARVEEEIQTLRTVLASKIHHSRTPGIVSQTPEFVTYRYIWAISSC